MFKKGDKVYHRRLRWHGEFEQYDPFSKNDAYVIFTDDEGFTEERLISVSLLDKIE